MLRILLLVILAIHLAAAGFAAVATPPPRYYVDRGLSNTVYRIVENKAKGTVNVEAVYPAKTVAWRKNLDITARKGRDGVLLLGYEQPAAFPGGSGFYTVTVLRRNSRGGYDLVDLCANCKPELSLEEVIQKYSEDEYEGESLAEDVWLPIRNNKLLDLYKQVHELSLSGEGMDVLSRSELINSLLHYNQEHEHDYLAMITALDASVILQDYDLLKRMLVELEPAFEQSGGEFLTAVPDYYHLLLEGKGAADRNSNFYARRQATSQTNTPALSAWQKHLNSIDFEHRYIAYDKPLMGRMKGVPNFLNLQILAKYNRVLAEFDLMEGHTNSALNRLFPVLRENIIVMRESPMMIEQLISIAITAITTKGLENAFFNGFVDPVSMNGYLLDLENARDELLHAVKRNPLDEYGETGRFRTIGGATLQQNVEEQEVRRDVTVARFLNTHSAAHVRYHLLLTDEYPEGIKDKDPFTNYSEPLNWKLGDNEELIIYSLGPDQKDDNGLIEYDPTNGTVSAGDLTIAVSRERRFPFPVDDELPASRDGIVERFKDGLPADPFANERYRSYILSDTTPVVVWSVGPDTDQEQWVLQPLVDIETPPTAGKGVATSPSGTHIYQNNPPEPQYDPTNGIVSDGNIFRVLY